MGRYSRHQVLVSRHAGGQQNENIYLFMYVAFDPIKI